jgi:prepilin-type N-terminal cleavage/methylation domain-containing protein
MTGKKWWQKMSYLSKNRNNEVQLMRANNNESGFSLIELLLVVVIIGIVAAIAVPAYQKGMRAAENGSIFATLRIINSTQVTFYSQNSRFGRLTELNPIVGNGLGAVVGDRLVRRSHIFEMSPLVPTDAELKNEYKITATRAFSDATIRRYELTQTGEITQVFP